MRHLYRGLWKELFSKVYETLYLIPEYNLNISLGLVILMS